MKIEDFAVNFLGDSITEGVGVTDTNNCRYDNRLAAMCQLRSSSFSSSMISELETSSPFWMRASSVAQIWEKDFLDIL